MTSRMVGSVLTLVILLFSVVDGAAQTYTQMQWGMNKGVTPYAFGANINGTWRDLGTVSAAGVWGLTPSTITASGLATFNAGARVYGSATVLGKANVAQRVGAIANSAGIDAAVLMGATNGNAPFIGCFAGETAAIAACQFFYNTNVAWFVDSSARLNWTQARVQNSTLYSVSASKPAGDPRAYANWFDSNSPLVVAGPNNGNGIIGAVYQNNAVSLSYPTGVTGYALLDTVAAGNTAFGMFGRCDAYAVGGCVGAEFNTFNYSGNANAVFPPVSGPYPVATNEHNAIQAVNYGTYTSKIGLYVTSGIAGYGFQAGIYLNPLASNAYGVFQDANAVVGPVTSAQFNTTGTAGTTNLGLQMKGVAATGAKFIEAKNSSGTSIFSVDKDGLIFGGLAYVSSSSFPGYRINNAGNGTDAKQWDILAFNGSGDLSIRALNDAYAASNTAITISRSGYTISAISVFAPLKLKSYTVATLPTCNAGTEGSMAYVTDATAPTYGGVLTGGGAVKVPVFCDGSAWSSH